MNIKIVFNKKEIKKCMAENKWSLPQLSYFWGINMKKMRQILDDTLYIDSKYISKIVISDYDLIIFNSEN